MSQNAADSASPLDCSPECPQEEYVYDYQYAGSAGEKENTTRLTVIDALKLGSWEGGATICIKSGPWCDSDSPPCYYGNNVLCCALQVTTI